MRDTQQAAKKGKRSKHKERKTEKERKRKRQGPQRPLPTYNLLGLRQAGGSNNWGIGPNKLFRAIFRAEAATTSVTPESTQVHQGHRKHTSIKR